MAERKFTTVACPFNRLDGHIADASTQHQQQTIDRKTVLLQVWQPLTDNDMFNEETIALHRHDVMEVAEKNGNRRVSMKTDI